MNRSTEDHTRKWRLGALIAVLAAQVVLVAGPTNAAFPGTNGKIAFWRAGGGVSTVTLDDDRTTEQLTTDWDRKPAWSPNGEQIAVESTRDGRVDIWVMNADGSGAQNLTPGAASGSEIDGGPAWSSDGTQIVFERWQKGSWDIWVMNADGTGEKKLTTDKADNRRPVWSPVDDRIAFGSNRSSRHFAIHTMDPDGSEIVRLTDYDQLEGPPDWSPDGGHLAFVREEGRGKNQTTNIWRIEADGSNPQRLTGNTGDVDVDQAYDSSPAWSPDGERIAFASNRGGNLQIHVMSAADGSGGEQLTFGDVASFSPDWQPVLATEANTLARANTRADTVRAATVVRSSFEMSRTTLVSIALAVLFASIGPAAYAGNEANALDPKRDCARDGHSAVGDKPDPFFLPGPDPDPFYAQPHHFPCLPPGTILDSRMVPFSPAGGVPMPQHPAWHLKFVSADTFGRPIAAVATVVKPMDANAANPPKLLSYQNAENSLGTQCSSSHTLAGGTDNGPNQGATSNWLPALVEEGWTLVIPDHLGPTMSYPVAATSAHITLDAIRAALRFGPLGLKPDTPAALWGYSGGAFPAAWGAGLQHSYAPELNIVGSASGGTPARVEPSLRLPTVTLLGSLSSCRSRSGTRGCIPSSCRGRI